MRRLWLATQPKHCVPHAPTLCSAPARDCCCACCGCILVLLLLLLLVRGDACTSRFARSFCVGAVLLPASSCVASSSLAQLIPRPIPSLRQISVCVSEEKEKHIFSFFDVSGFAFLVPRSLTLAAYSLSPSLARCTYFTAYF